jgi:hypothetical protein
MKRVTKYGLLMLAGMLIGFPLGFWHAQTTIGVGAKILSQTLALSEYETLANLQYSQADPDHATDAQRDLLSFMRRLRATQEVALPTELDFDQAKVLMRLALLEEQAGYSDGFQRYMQQARETLCHSLTHCSFTEKQMREFIAQAEANPRH